jgi:2-polyprenyl-3-methyl-5-hydroxy-6-metoxy-1,4-benzoquinol methylase
VRLARHHGPPWARLVFSRGSRDCGVTVMSDAWWTCRAKRNCGLSESAAVRRCGTTSGAVMRSTRVRNRRCRSGNMRFTSLRRRGEVTVTDEPSGEPYGPGHSDAELERLAVQARLIEPITRRWFIEAGITNGMRVLDVGSGVGDVAMLAAELVGDSGEVVGIDRVAAPLVVAAARAAARSVLNVRFVEGDLGEMTFDEPFDAIVGRYVLMYQRDPTATLRRLVHHVRPGGVVAFHEPYRDGLRSFPAVPTYDRCWQFLDDVFRGTGADSIMGIKLHSVFVAAGLPSPTMRMEAVIAGGGECDDHIRFEVDPVRSIMPHIERLGLGRAEDIDVDTLVDRVRNELRESGGVIVGRADVGAWSRAH